MVVTYEEARKKIVSGDLVFFSSGRSLIARLIQAISGGPIFHCGIAFWADVGEAEPRLLLAQTDVEGLRIVALSSKRGTRMTVVSAPVAWTKIAHEATDWAGCLPYNWWDLVAVTLSERFGIWVPRIGRGEICSVYIANRLRPHLAGIRELCSPQGLYVQLVRKARVKLEVSA